MSDKEIRATTDFATRLIDAGKRIGELESLLRRVLTGPASLPHDVAKDIRKAMGDTT